MHKKHVASVNQVLLWLVLGLTGLFFLTILWVNWNAGSWYNFDVYADAKVAQYMFEQRSLFPEHWMFGNQFYTVATPVLSALLYGIFRDPFLSLSIASSVMTVLVLLSLVWCIGPYVGRRSLAVSVLCIIGGAFFGTHAGFDPEGMQLYYTMASFYACYFIGIFVTMGIWLRLAFGKKVPIILSALCFILNFALGMQSLREMLVLNLPLFALCLFLMIVGRWIPSAKSVSGNRAPNIYAALMLAANGMGCIFIRILQNTLPIHSYSIVTEAGSNLLANLRISLASFLRYSGLLTYEFNAYNIFKLVSGLYFTAVVLYALFRIVRERMVTPLSCMILLCTISMFAVFFAGVLVITIRSIYYFVWYILVALSFAFVTEYHHKDHSTISILLISLLLIGSINWVSHFGENIRTRSKYEAFHAEIANTLQEDGITTVYHDIWASFLSSRIIASTHSPIDFAGIELNTKEEDLTDLLTYIKYLHSSTWFAPEQLPHSYLMLTQAQLDFLDSDVSPEYRDALLSHLTLARHFAFEDEAYFFYSLDQQLFYDLIDYPQ